MDATRMALTLPFKGRRNYLHGTDFYNQLLVILPQALSCPLRPPFRMIIHKFARHQCDLLFGEKDSASGRPEELVVEIGCQSESGRVIGWLVETVRPVTDRYDYDDERVESRSVIDGGTISVAEESGCTPVEVVVSLTRRLHYTLYPTKDQWVFTRLDLNRFFRSQDSRLVTIRMEHNLHNRMTKSAIEVSGEVIGHICFSLVKR